MNRWTVLYAVMLVLAILALGCSGSGNPVSPDNGLTERINTSGPTTQTHLWGYYDIFIDIETQTVEAVPNRGAMFTANVVGFVNNPPTNLAFIIHGTPVGADFIDVDIDVAMTHPFAGISQYDGYDVRGVFIGQGVSTLMYDNDLDYAAYGTDDQVMYDYDLGDDPDIGYEDPYDGLVGMPDGYTRWWNPEEFLTGVLGYVQGALATPGYRDSLTATLNPYKYFADDLGVEDDLYEWLEANTADGYFGQGIFTAGSTNTRNYYLRFPNVTGVNYGYAITADWANELDEDPPPLESHMVETPAISVAYNGDVYFVDASNNGGNFIADINVWGWDYQPSTVYIETDVHTLVNNTAVQTGGTDNYSTWSVDFPVDNVTALEGNEYWVICEYGGYSYDAKYTDYSPDGTYPEALLAAFFRYDLAVLDSLPCDGPVITDVSPDMVFINSNPTFTVTGTGLLDGSMLWATLTLGAETIACDSATWVSDTQVDCVFTLGDETQDFWDFNMTHGECPTVTTLADEVEISELSWEIVPHSGELGSADPVGVTPSHSGDYIDIACMGYNSHVYLLLDTGVPNDGYVDHWNEDVSAIQNTGSFYVANPVAPAQCYYGNAFIDVNDGGSSYAGLKGMIGPGWHWYMDENCAGGGGIGYVQYAPDHPVDAVSAGNGTVYTYHAFSGFGPTYRSYAYAPPWDSSTISLVSGSSDFDGVYQNQLVGAGHGEGPDDFWSLRTVSPHVFQYSNRTWAGTAGNEFGNTGTADGEISNPIDISISDGDRIYILDSPSSGATRIQCFDFSGTFLGKSDPDYVAGGDPYRMDRNEYDQTIYVLYDDNTIQSFKDMTE